MVGVHGLPVRVEDRIQCVHSAGVPARGRQILPQKRPRDTLHRHQQPIHPPGSCTQQEETHETAEGTGRAQQLPLPFPSEFQLFPVLRPPTPPRDCTVTHIRTDEGDRIKMSENQHTHPSTLRHHATPLVVLKIHRRSRLPRVVALPERPHLRHSHQPQVQDPRIRVDPVDVRESDQSCWPAGHNRHQLHLRHPRERVERRQVVLHLSREGRVQQRVGADLEVD